MKKTLLWLMCAGCGVLELRVGAREGIKPVQGDAQVSLDGVACGQPFTAEGYAVTSEVVGADCRVRVERDVVVATEEDYERVSELKDLANLVKAVELEVQTLQLSDADREAPLALETRVREATLQVNGQQVLTHEQLKSLPRTVRLEGEALEPLRAQLNARQTAVVHLTVTAVLKPPLPGRLEVSYAVQPILVLGPR